MSFNLSVLLSSKANLAGVRKMRTALAGLRKSAKATGAATAVAGGGGKSALARQAAFTKAINGQRAVLAAHKRSMMSTNNMIKAAMIGGPVYAALKFEDAMAQVRKVSGITWKEMKAYGHDVLDISERLPQTGMELAKIMEQAAKFGIRGRKELAQFTEQVGNMSVAWDMGGEETGETMALLRGIFGEGSKDIVASLQSIGDAMNHLGNNTRTSPKKIVDFFNRAAFAAKTAGFTGEQSAAIGATLTESGMPGTRAGLNMRLIFMKMRSLAGGSKELAAMAKKQGMDDKDIAKLLSPVGNRRRSLQTLGYTQKSWEAGMNKNAMGHMFDFLGRLDKMSKNDRGHLLTKMFGESQGAIVNMMGNMPALARNTALVDEEFAKLLINDTGPMWVKLRKNIASTNPVIWKLIKAERHHGSVVREVARRNETRLMRIKLAWSTMFASGVTLAEGLLEPLAKIAEWFASIASAARKWARANPELASTIAKVVAGLLALNVAGLAVGAAIAVARLRMLAWGASLAGASASGAGLKGVLSWLAFTPWGRAVAVGIGLAIANMDKLKAAASEVLTLMGRFGEGFSEAFTKQLTPPPGAASGWQELSQSWNELSASFKDLTGLDMGAIHWDSLESAAESLGNAFGNLAGGGVSLFLKGLKGIVDMAKKAMDGMTRLKDWWNGTKTQKTPAFADFRAKFSDGSTPTFVGPGGGRSMAPVAAGDKTGPSQKPKGPARASTSVPAVPAGTTGVEKAGDKIVVKAGDKKFTQTISITVNAQYDGAAVASAVASALKSQGRALMTDGAPQ